jgi:DNA-directed RNA polymerase specialized sigma24 family protein
MQMARGLTQSPERAEEMTQETFLLLQTTRPWRPDGPSLHVHLWGVLRSIRHHERAKHDTRGRNDGRFYRESTLIAEEEAEPSPEDAFEARGRRARAKNILRAVRERLAGKPLDLEIVDLMLDEITKREHLVAATGQPTEAVKHSLARIRRYTEAVLAERGEDWEHDQ